MLLFILGAVRFHMATFLNGHLLSHMQVNRSVIGQSSKLYFPGFLLARCHSCQLSAVTFRRSVNSLSICVCLCMCVVALNCVAGLLMIAD